MLHPGHPGASCSASSASSSSLISSSSSSSLIRGLVHRRQRQRASCRLFTFVDEVLGLQVEALPVTLPPQAGDGGVELAAAVGLHRGRCGHEVPLAPAEQSSPSPRPLPQALRRHLEGQVVVGDVDVSRVGALVGVVFTPLPVPPRVRLVPVVGADGHGEQPQRTESQEQPRPR